MTHTVLIKGCYGRSVTQAGFLARWLHLGDTFASIAILSHMALLPLPLAATALGLAIGLRHAFEPDHLMAVATLVPDSPGSRAALRLGASWGIGHTLALLTIGATLIAARQSMPDGLAGAFELVVATMIFAMGVRAIVSAWRMSGDGLDGPHAHGDVHHSHAVPLAHLHVGPWTVATRPLLVGLAHGLAGSGALTAMAMASLPSWPEQMAFMLLFGLGSTVGMAAVSGLAGWPLARLALSRRVLAGVSAATGVAAMLFSVVWGAPLVMARFGG